MKNIKTPFSTSPFNPFSGFECVGAIEFVNYMLLQSDPAGFLGLFDAWPRDMDASFERLRGRGAFVVSSSLRGGVVGNTTVVSQRGGRCVVRRPRSWSRDAVRVRDGSGSVVALDWESSSRGEQEWFAWTTAVGATYTASG